MNPEQRGGAAALDTSTSSICSAEATTGADAAGKSAAGCTISIAVALKQPAHPLHLRPRLLARAVADEAHLCGRDAAKSFMKSLAMTTTTSSWRDRTASSGSDGPSTIVTPAVLAQPVHQRRRALRRRRPGTVTSSTWRAVGEGGEHHADDDRRQERAEEHGKNRSAIARPVLQPLRHTTRV
jgi:hypothetical protein